MQTIQIIPSSDNTCYKLSIGNNPIIQINDKEFFSLYSEIMKVIKREDENPDVIPQVKITNPHDQYFGQLFNVITTIDDLGVKGVIVETPNGEWFYGMNEVEVFSDNN